MICCEIFEVSHILNFEQFMVGIPVCIIKGGSDLVMHHEHHEDDSPKPDYMKIRNKEYSWECGDCAYFDMKCWKACRAEKA